MAIIYKKVEGKDVPKCRGCNKTDDTKRFAYFFRSKVHPATLIEPDLPADWYEEYSDYKAYCLIECPSNKCKRILEL